MKNQEEKKMNVRQKVLFKIKSCDFKKNELPKKVSSYFGENTFSQVFIDIHFHIGFPWLKV